MYYHFPIDKMDYTHVKQIYEIVSKLHLFLH